jgi:hypothetical protein
MIQFNVGMVAWPGAVLFLVACSAPLPMDADAQSAVSAVLGNGSVSFSDTLELSGSGVGARGGPGWWFTRSDLGNGYVSRRAEARSPSHVGDEYSNNNPSGQWQALSRQFVLPGATLTECTASVWIDPLAAVHGLLEIDDAATRAPLRSESFSLAGTKTWTLVATEGDPLGSPTSNAIIVRVELLGNGEWQEFLFDDVLGNCGRR